MENIKGSHSWKQGGRCGRSTDKLNRTSALNQLWQYLTSLLCHPPADHHGMHVCQHILTDLKKTQSLPNFTVTSNTQEFLRTQTMHAHAYIYTDTHAHTNTPSHYTHTSGGSVGTAIYLTVVNEALLRLRRASDKTCGISVPMPRTSRGFHWFTEQSPSACACFQIKSLISEIRCLKEANLQEWNFHFVNLKYVEFLLL